MTHSENPIGILIVEDDLEDQNLIIDLLAAGRGDYAVFTAPTPDAGHEALASSQVDVCIVDFLLGASDGLTFIADAQQGGFTGAFLMVTGFGGPDVDDRALDLGVVQYLPKSELNVEVLDRAVRYAGSRRVQQPAAVDRFSKRKGNLSLQMALARDTAIRDAAAAAGISERTAHRRMREEGFMDEVDRLRVELEGRMLDIAAQDVLKGDQPA